MQYSISQHREFMRCQIVDKWKLFEMLNNDNADIKRIEEMNAEDVKEALIEYSIDKERNNLLKGVTEDGNPRKTKFNY